MTAAFNPTDEAMELGDRSDELVPAVRFGLLAITLSTTVMMVLLGQVIPPVIVFNILFIALAVRLPRLISSRPTWRNSPGKIARSWTTAQRPRWRAITPAPMSRPPKF